VLLIVYLNVLDFSFRIKTTTFYFTSKVELVRQILFPTARNPNLFGGGTTSPARVCSSGSNGRRAWTPQNMQKPWFQGISFRKYV
jgi:hypothetical protein